MSFNFIFLTKCSLCCYVSSTTHGCPGCFNSLKLMATTTATWEQDKCNMCKSQYQHMQSHLVFLLLKTGRPKRKISLSEHCPGKNLLLQEVRIIGKKITLLLFLSEMISKDQDLNSEQQTAFGLFTTFNPKNNKDISSQSVQR